MVEGLGGPEDGLENCAEGRDDGLEEGGGGLEDGLEDFEKNPIVNDGVLTST